MNEQPAIRVGTGFDVHRLAVGRKLILGGVKIPFEKGLDGHSDADALLHAVCDALLGAMAAGDIGQHFPNTDPQWENGDSEIFVKHALNLAAEAGYFVGNMDATILAERPKLLPHLPRMRTRLAAILNIDENCVGLKAGTMEQMGFVGREEGIAAMAIVTLIMKVSRK